jgi:hypothetical protein
MHVAMGIASDAEKSERHPPKYSLQTLPSNRGFPADLFTQIDRVVCEGAAKCEAALADSCRDGYETMPSRLLQSALCRM